MFKHMCFHDCTHSLRLDSIQVLPNEVSKNRFIRLKILTYESPLQRYIKNRVKLWEQIEFKG